MADDKSAPEGVAIEITFGTTERTSRVDLKKRMSAFGEVEVCHMGTRGQDFPFVRFKEQASAEAALKACNEGEVSMEDGSLLAARMKSGNQRRRESAAPPPETVRNHYAPPRLDVCWIYARSGFCKHGVSCKFSHSAEDAAAAELTSRNLLLLGQASQAAGGRRGVEGVAAVTGALQGLRRKPSPRRPSPGRSPRRKRSRSDRGRRRTSRSRERKRKKSRSRSSKKDRARSGSAESGAKAAQGAAKDEGFANPLFGRKKKKC
ncbi:unnamed protein product [Polarella glacialis]|uniref:C3H1-type domain-containing protein n=1 Tax=Polarella glacialis TaxID=89957 RepID=A0A813GMI1_POLGL|nr:unnamed protein product [Polarella glacialis]